MGAFDANGDGLADVAFSYASEYEPPARAFAAAGTRSGSTGMATARSSSRPARASGAALGDQDFGASLTAVDLEGDGMDELLATTRSGEVRLTTLAWKARKGTLGCGCRRRQPRGNLRGRDLAETLTPPPGTVRGFGRGIR